MHCIDSLVESIIVGMKGIIIDGAALNPGDLNYDSLTSLADFTVRDRTASDQVLEVCRDMDIVITNKVPFDRERLSALPRLKYIGVTATGYNIIDIEECRKRGIAITNIPSYSTDAVAQHVFAFILNISNAIALHDRSVKDGAWQRSKDFCYWLTDLFELRGKRIGIVGLGNIGRKVATIAKAFSMDVVSYSPHSRMDGVEALPLDELLKTSDIITMHCPLAEETKGMINSESLGKVKKGAILVNASRGPLVDSQAVIRALDEGALSWYCADVLEKEPPVDDPLTRHERTLITPHIAWAPKETRERLLGILVDNLKSWLEGGDANRIV